MYIEKNKKLNIKIIDFGLSCRYNYITDSELKIFAKFRNNLNLIVFDLDSEYGYNNDLWMFNLSM